MAQYTHNIDYVYKYVNESFGLSFSFTNDLDTGETLSSCTASIYDIDGTEQSSSMIANVTTTSPSVGFTIYGGSSGEAYEIKLAGVSSVGSIFIHYITVDVFDTVTINSKLGDPEANSYITLQQANYYIRNKYGYSSTWDNLDFEGRKRLLINAARDIDRFRFYGNEYYDSQVMKFPRDDHEVITGNCATPFSTTTFSNANLYSTTYSTYPQDYWKYGSVHITAATPLNETSLIASSNVTTGLIHFDALSEAPTTNTQFIIFKPIYQEIQSAQCEQALYLAENTRMEALSEYKSLGVETVKIGDAVVTFGEGGLASLSIAPVAKKILSKFIDKSLMVYRK